MPSTNPRWVLECVSVSGPEWPGQLVKNSRQMRMWARPVPPAGHFRVCRYSDDNPLWVVQGTTKAGRYVYKTFKSWVLAMGYADRHSRIAEVVIPRQPKITLPKYQPSFLTPYFSAYPSTHGHFVVEDVRTSGALVAIPIYYVKPIAEAMLSHYYRRPEGRFL